MDKRVEFLDKLYWAKSYIQLLALYGDKELSENDIEEYEKEEYDYLIKKGNSDEDIKKGFKYAKELAELE